MRTQSEIKKNNIRKANLLRESESRKERGQMTSKFGLYEQCGTGLDTQGEYMGAPMGTEPMDMMGDDMMDMDMDMDMDMMLGDDDVAMDDEMLMIFMEDKNAKPDFLDLDGDGNTTEPMKKAAKDKMDEKSGCGGKRYNEGNCGGSRRYNEEDLDEEITGGRGDCDCPPNHIGSVHNPVKGCIGTGCTPIKGMGGSGKVSDYETEDHKDRSKFDGRKSRVVGVDSNIEKQRMMKESYKAVSATPQKDGWGNSFNNILTENTQVNEVNSLMKRMKKVIR
jgi:hypothetical protein